MRETAPATAELATLESFALDLARAAAAITLPLFRGEYAHDDKGTEGAYDPVTDADRGAEAAIRRLIGQRFPDHGVIGEEYGEDRPDAEFVWVLDPVDGTRAFVSGLPLWATLIALRHEGAPVIGVIAQPYLDEIFIGGPSGARLISRGGQCALKTRTCSNLATAVLATTDVHLFQHGEREAFERVRSSVRLTRYGCDAYAYAMVALGRIDLVVESGLKTWDYEALRPVVERAGGVVTNWRGLAPGPDGRVLAAGDPRLHTRVAEIIGRFVD